MGKFFKALILFIIWSFLSMWWYYSCDYCHENVKEEKVAEKKPVIKKEIPRPVIKNKSKFYDSLVVLNNSGNILFSFPEKISIVKDSTHVTIPQQSEAIIDSIGSYLRKHQKQEVGIISWYHASESNIDQIGTKRAAALKSIFTENGINPDKISIRDSLVDFKFTDNKFDHAILFQFKEMSSEKIEQVNQGITNKTLFTKFNSRNFEPDNTLQTYAQELKTYLAQYPDKKVTLIGYTDDQGEERDNFIISRDRATNVMKYLISQGIAEEKFTVIP
ncbi:MAG: OmpA family protein, partial [Flavobacteriaceae bacterium]|nr:OmpA family protein [Flavobacteriaceae bacterium]